MKKIDLLNIENVKRINELEHPVLELTDNRELGEMSRSDLQGAVTAIVLHILRTDIDENGELEHCDCATCAGIRFKA